MVVLKDTAEPALIPTWLSLESPCSGSWLESNTKAKSFELIGDDDEGQASAARGMSRQIDVDGAELE
ncbi:hypothetical protein PanWU01x14_173930 [Parasponia andersonii]|uniref:Uncharacterized protein n=1 Tax=Parasponia andersonii TaxID=3476 RepID=A0A2P5C8X4_PARAD|nr:hypothetical protein PanWU01x14_173930 [Parasponia andersonii]